MGLFSKKVGAKDGLYELVYVGERFGPFTYPVDDHMIKAFAFAQNDYNPWYFTDDTPFGHRTAHAAILSNHLLTIFLTEYDPNKVVGLHTQEELWFQNPIKAGEDITIKAEYVDKYEKRGKGHVVLESNVTGADGRPIVKHRGIEIMRITSAGIPKERTAEIEGDKVTGEYDRSIPKAEKASAGIAIGTPVKELTKHTTNEQTQIYSWIGEHFETIHNNMKAARNAGYETLVVQGMQQVSFITEMLTNFFGAPWFTSGYEKIKMLRPLLAGDTVTYEGVITDKTAENGKTRLHLHVWGRNSKGELTVVGWANALAG